MDDLPNLMLQIAAHEAKQLQVPATRLASTFNYQKNIPGVTVYGTSPRDTVCSHSRKGRDRQCGTYLNEYPSAQVVKIAHLMDATDGV